MKKRTPSRRGKYRVKRETPKTTTSDDVKGHGSTENVSNTHLALLQLLHQLETQTLDANSKTSWPAFEVLTDTLREVLAWLHSMAALHPLSLGALLRGSPEHDAWAKYEGGEHVGAWAAVELARLYRQIQGDLRSRSNDSVNNRLRAIRYGFVLGRFVVPPNAWFCEEYARKADYRPRGKMAVWTAGKIEELRRIKENRSQMRGYANIEIVEGRLRLRTESETNDVLANWFRAEMVEGEALKRLDNLPVFGSPDADDLTAWRKFVRNRLLTSKVIGQFDQLFPNSRRKLDGVIVATLDSAWRAVHQDGKVILP